jgi:hypothetical protein
MPPGLKFSELHPSLEFESVNFDPSKLPGAIFQVRMLRDGKQNTSINTAA